MCTRGGSLGAFLRAPTHLVRALAGAKQRAASACFVSAHQWVAIESGRVGSGRVGSGRFFLSAPHLRGLCHRASAMGARHHIGPLWKGNHTYSALQSWVVENSEMWSSGKGGDALRASNDSES